MDNDSGCCQDMSSDSETGSSGQWTRSYSAVLTSFGSGLLQYLAITSVVPDEESGKWITKVGLTHVVTWTATGSKIRGILDPNFVTVYSFIITFIWCDVMWCGIYMCVCVCAWWVYVWALGEINMTEW